MLGEQSMATLTLSIPYGDHNLSEFTKPSTKLLSKSVQGFLQFSIVYSLSQETSNLEESLC